MSRNSILPILATPLLAACFLFASPDPVQARRMRSRSTFYYSSSSSILRGQLALQRDGYLSAGEYEPGRYDTKTRAAIRNFQHHHHMRPTGRFDRDTYAVLPIDDRPDEDDDGIPDADDRCPDTKKGTRVGLDGCPVSDEKSSAASDQSDTKKS